MLARCVDSKEGAAVAAAADLAAPEADACATGDEGSANCERSASRRANLSTREAERVGLTDDLFSSETDDCAASEDCFDADDLTIGVDTPWAAKNDESSGK